MQIVDLKFKQLSKFLSFHTLCICRILLNVPILYIHNHNLSCMHSAFDWYLLFCIIMYALSIKLINVLLFYFVMYAFTIRLSIVIMYAFSIKLMHIYVFVLYLYYCIKFERFLISILILFSFMQRKFMF